MNTKLISLLVFIILCQAVGVIAGLVTVNEIPVWYHSLIRPPITPPDYVFGPAWTTLYLLMAVAAWRVWKIEGGSFRSTSMRLFIFQLGLNYLWSFIFFKWHLLLASVVEIYVLWIAIALTINAFQKVDSLAAKMMLPYLAWVSFASVLATWFWVLNP